MLNLRRGYCAKHAPAVSFVQFTGAESLEGGASHGAKFPFIESFNDLEKYSACVYTVLTMKQVGTEILSTKISTIPYHTLVFVSLFSIFFREKSYGLVITVDIAQLLKFHFVV